MTPEQTRALVSSRRSSDRRLASRAILDDPTLIERKIIEGAFHREPVPHIRHNLAIALKKLSEVSRDATEPRAEDAKAIYDEAYLRALRTVTSDILHQLNPLIGDIAEAARQDIAAFEGSRTEDRLDQIRRQVDAIAKLHQAAKPAVFEEFDLSQIVRSCVPNDLDVDLVTLAFAGPEQFIVQGDSSLVCIAVTNTLRNAVEACLPLASEERKPTITLNWDVTDRDYWVTIIDEGVGYKGNIEGAFEVGNSTKGHDGHGLPSARAAMQSLSGSIDLIPLPDGGCSVSLSWPAVGGVKP